MKYIFSVLILLSFWSCKKSANSNLGACKTFYESNNSTIVIDNIEIQDFCYLEGNDYLIDISSLNLTNISWNTEDSTSVIEVNKAGVYNGSGINSANEVVKFTFEANNCNNVIYIPNSFTPNNDGINDVWAPILKSTAVCSENYQLLIYDNTQQLIYSTSTSGLGWDGTTRGLAAKQGVYYYELEYKREDGKITKESGQILLQV